MNLSTVFQLSICGLTGMAGAMLAYGEEAPFPAGLTVFLSVLALFFNEWHRTIRIGLMWCSLMGLVAMAFAVFEFLGESLEARLLAGAHFLVYLTWIVLFQDKRIRQYWWLFALSLLQVAVGSVLTSSGWYGLFLLGYLLAALWTMALFHVYQGALAFHADGLDATLLLDDALSPPVVAKSGAKSGATSRTDRPAAVAPGMLASPSIAFDRLPQTIVENSIQQDVANRWITPRYVSGVTGISVVGLSLGLLMFLLVPRFWVGEGNPFSNRAVASSGALAGFTSDVRLGHLGRILESNEPVLQLKLFNQTTNAPVGLEEFAGRYNLEEPLFRGSVLDTYKSGLWSRPDPRREFQKYDKTQEMQSIPRGTGVFRQEFRIAFKGAKVLFGLSPMDQGRLDPDDRILQNVETRVLTPPSDNDPLEYFIFSAPSSPRESGPHVMPSQSAHVLPLTRGSVGQYYRPRYLSLPPEGLERLKALAADWTAPQRLVGDARLSPEARKALTLERHLRDSGEYTYSLNMTIKDPASDPVEDFLLNRKNGHCEYYASALALMLRAVEIPSRLVTGFKGAEFFKGGGFYEVQQRHAHAWVEAFIDGQWMVLDATPGERDESVKTFGSKDYFWNAARSSLSNLWSTYVVSMSYSRQKESLYDPLTGGLNSLRGSLAGLQRGVQWFKNQVTDPQQLLTWRGAGALLALVAVCGLPIWLLRRWWVWREHQRSVYRRPSKWRLRWQSWIGQLWGDAHGPRIVIQFYERFLTLASTRGLRPQGHQTHREFARQVEHSLAETLGGDPLATLPADVTESYYRVRFGGADLPTAEISNLDARMQQFAERLRPGARRPTRA